MRYQDVLEGYCDASWISYSKYSIFISGWLSKMLCCSTLTGYDLAISVTKRPNWGKNVMRKRVSFNTL